MGSKILSSCKGTKNILFYYSFLLSPLMQQFYQVKLWHVHNLQSQCGAIKHDILKQKLSKMEKIKYYVDKKRRKFASSEFNFISSDCH